MFGWGDFEVRKEQHQDRLHRAEQQRLIEQAEKDGGGSWLKQVVSRLAANKDQSSDTGKTPACRDRQWVEKTT
jgi:hypothetical protein